MKIRPVGAEFFHADGRTDGHVEAFRNFAKAPRDVRILRDGSGAQFASAIHITLFLP